MFKDTKAFSSFAVPDLEAARAFYADTLGIETSEHVGLLTLYLGGDRETLIYLKPNHEPATYTVLNFPVPDIDATNARRADMRKARLAKAVPVSEWIAKERQRIEKGEFVPEVAKMYRSAMALSPRFAREFREFWGLAPDHQI